jgi:hypothetical protein
MRFRKYFIWRGRGALALARAQLELNYKRNSFRCQLQFAFAVAQIASTRTRLGSRRRPRLLHVGVAGAHILIERGFGERVGLLQPFTEFSFARQQSRGCCSKLFVVIQGHDPGSG